MTVTFGGASESGIFRPPCSKGVGGAGDPGERGPEGGPSPGSEPWAEGGPGPEAVGRSGDGQRLGWRDTLRVLQRLRGVGQGLCVLQGLAGGPEPGPGGGLKCWVPQ